MIRADLWPKVKVLFADVMDERPEARAGYLRSICHDPVLVDEVCRLIALEEDADGFLSEAAAAAGCERPGFESGQVIGGRYRVERLLGRGGMCGGVHEAFDLHSGTRVALKATTDLREFFAARAVEHPNVCRVFECGSEGDPHFLAMELLEGVTLEERLAERGAMGLEEWRAFAAQLCAGLGAIHEAGLIHRDLKPSNIFLTTAGRVVIIDFGLARFVQQGAFEGAGRQSAGTLLYMAPEVLAGKQASVRSDIHSLGVVLEEALTGEAPVDSRGVSEAVRDCLHRNPAMRPGSVAAVTDTICCTREGFEVTSFGMLAALLG